MRSTYEKVPSLETRIKNVDIISDRVNFLKKTRLQFIKDKEKCLQELLEMQVRINSYNYKITEIDQELKVIKKNYKIIITDKDPLTKTRLVFRRFNIKCPVCNDLFFSKKDLMVHKSKRHSY